MSTRTRANTRNTPIYMLPLISTTEVFIKGDENAFAQVEGAVTSTIGNVKLTYTDLSRVDAAPKDYTFGQTVVGDCNVKFMDLKSITIGDVTIGSIGDLVRSYVAQNTDMPTCEININGKQYGANTVKNLLIIIYKFINFKSMATTPQVQDKLTKYGVFLHRIGKTVMRLRGEGTSEGFLTYLIQGTSEPKFEAITRSNIREFTNILYDIRFEAEKREVELLTKAAAYFNQRFGDRGAPSALSISTNSSLRLSSAKPARLQANASSTSTSMQVDDDLETLRQAAINVVKARTSAQATDSASTGESTDTVIIDAISEIEKAHETVHERVERVETHWPSDTDYNTFNTTGFKLSTSINGSLSVYKTQMTEYETLSEAYGNLILKARLAQKRAERAEQRAERAEQRAQQAQQAQRGEAAQAAAQAAQAAQAAAQKAAQAAAEAARAAAQKAAEAARAAPQRAAEAARAAAEAAAEAVRDTAAEAARAAATKAAEAAAETARQVAAATRIQAETVPQTETASPQELTYLLDKYNPNCRYYPRTSADCTADAANLNDYIKNEAIASTIYNSYIRPLGQPFSCQDDSLIPQLLLLLGNKDHVIKILIIEEKFSPDYKCSRKRTCMSGGGSPNTKVTILGRKRNIVIQKGRQYVKVQGELMLLSKAEKLAKQKASSTKQSTSKQPTSKQPTKQSTSKQPTSKQPSKQPTSKQASTSKQSTTKHQPSNTKQSTSKQSTSKQSTTKQSTSKQSTSKQISLKQKK